MGGECWGLGSWTSGGPEGDRGSQEAEGDAPSLAGGAGLPVCAMLSGAGSLCSIAQWGREHPRFAQSLGFSRERTPCVATRHHVFRRLDVEAFEPVLGRWARECLGEGEAAIFLSSRPGVRALPACARRAAGETGGKGGGCGRQQP